MEFNNCSNITPSSQGLLDTPNLPKEVYLGVGALAQAFCREHPCHHTKNDGIVALSNKLGAKLQNCRPKTKHDEDNVSILIILVLTEDSIKIESVRISSYKKYLNWT